MLARSLLSAPRLMTIPAGSALAALSMLPPGRALAMKIDGASLERPVEPAREPLGRLLGYIVLQQAPMSADDERLISAMLAAPGVYDDDGDMARCFFPGLALRFGCGDDAVQVLVCLECRRVVFERAGLRDRPRCPGARLRRMLHGFYQRMR